MYQTEVGMILYVFKSVQKDNGLTLITRSYIFQLFIKNSAKETPNCLHKSF